MSPRSVGIALAVVAFGLGGGWLLKGASARDAALSAVTSRSTAATPAAGPSRSKPRSASDEPSVFISRLSAALSISNRGKRERALAAIADDFDATQIREALAQLDKTRLNNRESIRAQLLARWAEIEPDAAAAYALALPNAPQRRNAAEAVVNGWAEHDAQSATRWVSTLPEGVVKKDAQSALLKVIAATDPQAALALLRNATGLSEQDSRDVSEMIFEKWAQVDPRQAAEAVAQLDESLRRGASFAVAAKWAAVDLPSALAWARTQPDELSRFSLPESTSTNNALTGVLQSWLVNDAEGAMQWLAELPAGLERENLIQCAR